MTEEERKFIVKVNVDKAKKKTILPIILIIFSLLTYIEPLLLGDFDFGIIFEVISFIFLLISRKYMTEYDEDRAKRYIVFSMLSIGWILVYDIITLCVTSRNIADVAFLGYTILFWEFLLIAYFGMLFSIFRNLAKADNPIKYKESTDWFYETYEKEEEGKNKNA